MLDNPGVRALFIRIIYRRISLEIRNRKLLHFKSHFPVLQFTKRIAKVRINCAGENHLLCPTKPLFLIFQKILFQLYRNAGEHLLHHSGIAFYGNALIKGIEIVVIIGETNRKPADNRCR